MQLHIEQNTALTETVGMSVISKLYDIVSAIPAEERETAAFRQMIKGRIQAATGYKRERDFLVGAFDEFHITIDQYLAYFADPKVRRVMKSQYGDMTVTQLAAITSLGGLFTDNANIETFDEFGETSVTELDVIEFSGCTSLRSVNLDNIVDILDYGGSRYTGHFGGCTSLERIYMPNLKYGKFNGNSFTYYNVSRLGFAVGCTNLRSVEMPELYTVDRTHQNDDFTTPSGSANGWIPLNNPFSGCITLEYVAMPKANVSLNTGDAYHNGSFQGNTSLKLLDFGNVKTIKDYFIQGCPNIRAIVIRNKYFVPEYNKTKSAASVANLLGNANALIYVDNTLYDNGDYANATNWSSLTANIRPIRDYDKDAILNATSWPIV